MGLGRAICVVAARSSFVSSNIPLCEHHQELAHFSVHGHPQLGITMNSAALGVLTRVSGECLHAFLTEWDFWVTRPGLVPF